MKKNKTVQAVNPITHYSVLINFRDGSSEEFPEVFGINVVEVARLLVIITANKNKVYPIELIKDYEFITHGV